LDPIEIYFSLDTDYNFLGLLKHFLCQSRSTTRCPLLRYLSFNLLQTKIAYFANTSLESSPGVLLSLLQQRVDFGSDDEFELFKLLYFDELDKWLYTPNVEEDHPVVAETAHFAFSNHKLVCCMPFSTLFP
jgi:hypothetical protein